MITKQAYEDCEKADVKSERLEAKKYFYLFTFHANPIPKKDCAMNADLKQKMSGTFFRYAIPVCFFLLSTCILFTLPGCDEAFEPIRKGDSYPFSIYGYLDASADTQWIRVTPPRPQISTPPVKPGMQVVLQEIESGNRAVMHDSLIQLPGGVNLVNAWTTMDVRPEHRYRVTAEDTDGETSSVTVTIPPDFPTPEINYLLPDGCRASVYIKDVKHLADVQWVWTYRSMTKDGQVKNGIVRIPYRQHILGGGRVLLSNAKYDIEVNIPGISYEIVSKDVFVASAGPEWIENIATLDDLELGLPNGKFSNVENGLGYMVGILSKIIPYEQCN